MTSPWPTRRGGRPVARAARARDAALRWTSPAPLCAARPARPRRRPRRRRRADRRRRPLDRSDGRRRGRRTSRRCPVTARPSGWSALLVAVDPSELGRAVPSSRRWHARGRQRRARRDRRPDQRVGRRRRARHGQVVAAPAPRGRAGDRRRPNGSPPLQLRASTRPHARGGRWTRDRGAGARPCCSPRSRSTCPERSTAGTGRSRTCAPSRAATSPSTTRSRPPSGSGRSPRACTSHWPRPVVGEATAAAAERLVAPRPGRPRRRCRAGRRRRGRPAPRASLAHRGGARRAGRRGGHAADRRPRRPTTSARCCRHGDPARATPSPTSTATPCSRRRSGSCACPPRSTSPGCSPRSTTWAAWSCCGPTASTPRPCGSGSPRRRTRVPARLPRHPRPAAVARTSSTTRLLLPLRLQQEVREFLYAVRHLPHWRLRARRRARRPAPVRGVTVEPDLFAADLAEQARCGSQPSPTRSRRERPVDRPAR